MISITFSKGGIWLRDGVVNSHAPHIVAMHIEKEWRHYEPDEALTKGSSTLGSSMSDMLQEALIKRTNSTSAEGAA
jgi:hypothetical protein